MGAVAVETDGFDAVKAAVSAGLAAYNDRFLPKARDRHPLAVSVRDDAGAIVGGLIGELRLGWLYVDLLWLNDSHRGAGWGRRLLEAAEAEARGKGAGGIYLWTWTFQAPDFYRAMGYSEVGRLKDHLVPGVDSIQFAKAL